MIESQNLISWSAPVGHLVKLGVYIVFEQDPNFNMSRPKGQNEQSERVCLHRNNLFQEQIIL